MYVAYSVGNILGTTTSQWQLLVTESACNPECSVAFWGGAAAAGRRSISSNAVVESRPGVAGEAPRARMIGPSSARDGAKYKSLS